MRPGPPPLLPAAALLALLACGPARDAPTPPRLVLLYAPCTVARDALQPYDPDVRYTPNLAAFARESVVFERHQTESPSSGIAYASILAGAQAFRHGVHRHPTRLAAALYLAPEAFRDHGYETFYWNRHGMVTPRLGYAQGVPRENRVSRVLDADQPRFQELLSRLREDPQARAFVTAAFTVTHSPYRLGPLASFLDAHPERAPDLPRKRILAWARSYRKAHHALSWNTPAALARLGIGPDELPAFRSVVRALYEANLRDLDRLFGGVVEAVRAAGLLDESLIAFTADHGELLYRENAPFRWSHSMQLAAEVLAVPLLVRHPDLAPGRYPGVTRSMDVYPTLAGLAGIALPEDRGVRGEDLSAALREGSPGPRLSAFSHTSVLVASVVRNIRRHGKAFWGAVPDFFPDESPEHVWVALRAQDRLYKLRRRRDLRWHEEAYDLAADPGQERNVFDPEDREDAKRMRDLRAYKSRLVRDFTRRAEGHGEQGLPLEEEAEALRELGYIR